MSLLEKPDQSNTAGNVFGNFPATLTFSLPLKWNISKSDILGDVHAEKGLTHWMQLYHSNSDLMISFAHSVISYLFRWNSVLLICVWIKSYLADLSLDNFLCWQICHQIISYLAGTEGRMVSQFTLMTRAPTLIHHQGDKLSSVLIFTKI